MKPHGSICAAILALSLVGPALASNGRTLLPNTPTYSAPQPGYNAQPDYDPQPSYNARPSNNAQPFAGGSSVNIPVGTLIPIALETPLDSKTAYAFEPIRARLLSDLAVNGQVVAPAGSEVLGHVTYAQNARRRLVSKISTERWCRSSGCIGLQFDQIEAGHGQEICVNAVPQRKGPVCSTFKGAGPLCANKNGQIRPTVMTSLKQEAKPLLVSGATMSTSMLISPFVAPVVGAVIGAAKPDLLMTPAPPDERPAHRRLKGMALGAVTGVPGGFLVTQTLTRGQEVVLHPEDQMMLVQTGGLAQRSTQAAAAPGDFRKVRG